jgi:hypothetical protein
MYVKTIYKNDAVLWSGKLTKTLACWWARTRRASDGTVARCEVHPYVS